jgi:hypothetical protein
VLSSTSSCGAPGPCLRCSASASATTSGIGMSRMLSAVLGGARYAAPRPAAGAAHRREPPHPGSPPSGRAARAPSPMRRLQPAPSRAVMRYRTSGASSTARTCAVVIGTIRARSALARGAVRAHGLRAGQPSPSPRAGPSPAASGCDGRLIGARSCRRDLTSPRTSVGVSAPAPGAQRRQPAGCKQISSVRERGSPPTVQSDTRRHSRLP